MKIHILITDDEVLARKSLQETLRFEGYNVSTAEDGLEALNIIKNKPVDVLLTDLRMPNVSGIELLKRVKEEYPDVQVILMSGYGNVENAVEAMRLGALDYLIKPIDNNRIKMLLEKIEETKDDGKYKHAGGVFGKKKHIAAEEGEKFYTLIGKNEKMRKIYANIESIANNFSNVLVCGESGTGKRMVAQAVHQADPCRRDKPFIEVSCGALPETLLESELFGHVKGAFTGAIKDRQGRFELANGGTILLDEIDTCSANLQVKLLRILEEGMYERVGDTRTLKAEVRIIAATNQNLEELVRKKIFREDLYWRLNVIKIQLPALKERVDDIPLLAAHLLSKYNKARESVKKYSSIVKISNPALKAMVEYNWPGNIRELSNAIERACVFCKSDTIQLEDLPDNIRNSSPKPASRLVQKEKFSLKSALKTPEKDIVLNALERTNWNCTRAAAYLGINRTTLYNKLKLYEINRKNCETDRINAAFNDPQ